MDDAGIEVEEVADPAALAALAPDWWSLWRRVPDASPFQSPAWLVPWWRVFGAPPLQTLAARRAGELVGLMPGYVRTEDGLRRLLPVGIGTSDHLDPLVDPAFPAGVARALIGAVAARAGRFDRVDLEGLRPGSPFLEVPPPPGWTEVREEHDPCPVLALPADRAGLAGAVPGGRWAKMAYYRRRAERIGPVSFRAAAGEEVGPTLERLFALHGARWRGRGAAGVLAGPDVRAFHRLAAPELDAAGLLRLFTLDLGARTVAVVHALAGPGRLHAYQGGWDDTLDHPGLGAFAIGLAIEAAAAEGFRAFDFLRGREPYKYTWGAVDRPLSARRLAPPAASRGTSARPSPAGRGFPHARG